MRERVGKLLAASVDKKTVRAMQWQISPWKNAGVAIDQAGKLAAIRRHFRRRAGR